MGAVSIELNKQEIRYEELFPLDTKDGLLALLNSLHEIRERRFLAGDFDASNLLIDLEFTIQKSGLTNNQKEALHLLYEKCFTQKEVAALLGTSQQAVLDRRNNALEKMALYNEKGLSDNV
jgi:DNA-directed RNA polymerase specialized sigma subunit